MDLVAVVMEYAKLVQKLMIKFGFIPPNLVAFKGDRRYSIKLQSYNTEDEKEDSFRDAVRQLRKLSPSSFIFISLARISTMQKEDCHENEDKHSYSDSQEILCIMGKQADRTVICHSPVIREDDSIKFGKEAVFDTRQKNQETANHSIFDMVYADMH